MIKKTVRFLPIFSIFVLLNSCEKKNTKNSKIEEMPVFLIYGALPPVGYTEEGDSVITKKFGFKLLRVSGCDVTRELQDSVKIINQRNNQLMIKKYGKNWIENFEKKSKIKMAVPDI